MDYPPNPTAVRASHFYPDLFALAKCATLRPVGCIMMFGNTRPIVLCALARSHDGHLK
jgi:hypothetical protein